MMHVVYEPVVDKWTRKYMKLAKAIADDNQACYSRKIGVVIISPDNTPVSFGYNGSISKSPHNDAPEYLAHLWQALLSKEEQDYIVQKHSLVAADYSNQYLVGNSGYPIIPDGMGQAFVNKFSNCKTCPRKLLDCKPGEKLELCNCSHAERNAIYNAAAAGISTKGATIFCWCGVPCHECAIGLIQSKIAKVVVLKRNVPDYSRSSRGLFAMARVELVEVNEKDILEG